MGGTYYSTGEAAKILGLSVRTLRYYDQIELMKPSLKDSYGKRLYSEEDLFQIEKISLLKSLSLSLSDIKKVLDQITISEVLAAHKLYLKKEIKTLQESVRRTNFLLNRIQIENEVNWKELLPFIKQSEANKQNKKEALQSLFNEQEQKVLRKGLPKLEDDGVEISKWIALLQKLEQCISKNLPVESQEVQLLIDEVDLLSDRIFNGDESFAQKFWEIRKSEELSSSMNLYPIKKEILDYLEAAYTYRELEGKSKTNVD